MLVHATNNLRTQNIAFYIIGKPTASDVILYYTFTQKTTLPISLSTTQTRSQTAATGSTAFSLKKDTSGGTVTTIGTITFAASARVGTISFTSAITFSAGDSLIMEAPSSQDATLANIGFNIVANR